MPGLNKAFFDKVRPFFPGGLLTETQVNGLEFLHSRWLKYGVPDNRQMEGYFLAYTAWETGFTMEPVKETQRPGQPVPTDAQVKARLTNAFNAGQLPWVKTPYWKDGWFGRGYTQLTHEVNFSGPARDAVLEVFGKDIHANPDLLLDPEISAFVAIEGALKGWFTTKKLSDFIDAMDEADKEDWREMVGARRVINGQDRAEKIANLGITFEHALALVPGPIPATAPVAPVPPKPAPQPIPAETPLQPAPAPAKPRGLGGIWVAIGIAAVLAIGLYLFLTFDFGL